MTDTEATLRENLISELFCRQCKGLGRWNHNPSEPMGWDCEDCNGTGWNQQVYAPDAISYLETLFTQELDKLQAMMPEKVPEQRPIISDADYGRECGANEAIAEVHQAFKGYRNRLNG